jgi:phosphotransferase system  glucose/maltose/N-acetylglucosamine-specific IIC component
MRCLPEQDFYLIIGVAILTSTILAVLFEMLISKFTKKKRGRKAKNEKLNK